LSSIAACGASGGVAWPAGRLFSWCDRACSAYLLQRCGNLAAHNCRCSCLHQPGRDQPRTSNAAGHARKEGSLNGSHNVYTQR
jgi:hypothetical protein